MKELAAILLAIFLTACGRHIYIGPEFQPLLKKYLAHAPNEGKLADLGDMRSGDPGHAYNGITDSGYVRVGVYKIHETRIIVRPLENNCDWQWVVMHELGHALHDLEHTTDTESIMWPGGEGGVDGGDYWCEHLDEKLDEMFH